METSLWSYGGKAGAIKNGSRFLKNGMPSDFSVLETKLSPQTLSGDPSTAHFYASNRPLTQQEIPSIDSQSMLTIH